MAKLYTKNTWVDEVLAAAARYNILQDDGTPINSNAQIELATAVTQAGTPADADKMNNLEDGLDAVDTRLDNLERMDLNELTAAADGDLLPIVDDPAGTPETKKITLANLRAAIAGAAAAIAGDFATVGWTDYSATSTVTGWSSFILKKIYYKKVGKLVYISFAFSGTSNSNLARFTLPYIASSPGMSFVSMIQIGDNSAPAYTIGMAEITSGANYIGMYKDANGGGWTASGTKVCAGQIWYQAA